MNGGFHPLKGFLGQADYDRVVADWRLADGTLWPMPVTLDVTEKFAEGIAPGQDIALRDQEGVILAILSVTDKWTPDKATRGARGLRLDRSAPPRGQLSDEHRWPRLSRRPGHRHPAADALRLQVAPRHAERAARLFPQARLAPDRRLPDAQPAAPGAPGADLPRRARGAGEPADPPRRRHDQARRHRPFHARALLRGGARQIPGRDDAPVAAEPRHADGRPARGRLARADPAQPRLHAFHRRARPCRPRQGQPGQGFLRAL